MYFLVQAEISAFFCVTILGQRSKSIGLLVRHRWSRRRSIHAVLRNNLVSRNPTHNYPGESAVSNPGYRTLSAGGIDGADTSDEGEESFYPVTRSTRSYPSYASGMASGDEQE